MENANPTKLDSERLDRMEQHLRLMKESISSIHTDSKKISDALIGNEYTGGIGIVHSIKRLTDDVEKQKDRIDRLDDNMNLVKWFGSGAGALFLAMIIYILQKQIG